ncbi:MAG: sigma-70 family RNA polymerase sigma factor [Opitutaceae bacterium]|nr:sigma-70 family RNA polymerase sigma factor [Opitutaceae bacterium]
MTDHPDPATGGGPTPAYEEFVRLFVAHEGRLRAFIRALLPTWADVDEVMQETSLVAWRKFPRFERGTNFLAWVATIARFEALDHLRRRGREQLVFSDVVADLLTEEAAQEADTIERQRRALDRCLAKLGDPQRELLLLSYQPGARLHEVATRAGRTVQGHYKAVQRLRARLLECIEGELKRDPA